MNEQATTIDAPAGEFKVERKTMPFSCRHTLRPSPNRQPAFQGAPTASALHRHVYRAEVSPAAPQIPSGGMTDSAPVRWSEDCCT